MTFFQVFVFTPNHHLNDIVSELNCNVRLFADDTSLYVIVENPINAGNIFNIHFKYTFMGYSMVS